MTPLLTEWPGLHCSHVSMHLLPYVLRLYNNAHCQQTNQLHLAPHTQIPMPAFSVCCRCITSFLFSLQTARHTVPKQFVSKYVSSAAGPSKWPKLVEFLAATYPRVMADLVGRQQNQVFVCVCLSGC